MGVILVQQPLHNYFCDTVFFEKLVITKVVKKCPAVMQPNEPSCSENGRGPLSAKR
jgi:hypothetical protein